MKISLYLNHNVNPVIQQNPFYVSYFCQLAFSIIAIISPQKTVLLSHKNIPSRMSEQLPVLLFNESAQMYNQGNFSVSLALLNDCILMHPQHSILYSNRALSNFARKDVDQAIQDLEFSIKLNHLNYVAYFNMFSIKLQRGNRQEAFVQLCKCLSSINTLIAKKNQGQLYVDEAIRFCFNNKQAIFMKAMENLQENRLDDAHTMIKMAFTLEDKEQNKEGLRLLLNQLENSLDIPETIPQPVQSFSLKTDLKCPTQVDFQETIKSMVGKFNSLNQLIGESSWNRESPSSEKSIQGSQKMEGQTNCMTFIGSHLEQQESMKKDEKIRNSYASTPENKDDKLHLQSTIMDNCEDQMEIQSKLRSFDLYPLGQTKNVSLYIQQAKFYEDVDSQNIYATFNYLSEEKNFQIQTALSNLKDGLCRWSKWSQAIRLASNSSTVVFTLIQKGSEDMIIGQGSFQLSQLGYLSVPFYMEEEQVGLLEMIVQRQQ